MKRERIPRSNCEMPMHPSLSHEGAAAAAAPCALRAVARADVADE